MGVVFAAIGFSCIGSAALQVSPSEAPAAMTLSHKVTGGGITHSSALQSGQNMVLKNHDVFFRQDLTMQ